MPELDFSQIPANLHHSFLSEETSRQTIFPTCLYGAFYFMAFLGFKKMNRSSRAEAGLATGTQHLCVLSALALQESIFQLSGPKFKGKKPPVIVFESCVS